jgi:hypothetical protein
MHRFCFIALLFTLIMSSCSGNFFDQVVDIDPPAYEKLLVVHTFTGSQDSVFRVLVTRNFGLLDAVEDSAFYVQNAKVQLFKNGQLLSNVPLSTVVDKGWYEAPLTAGALEAGASYELKITHPDFPDVTSTQVMPKVFQVDSVHFRDKAGVSIDGTELYAMDAYIKDKAGERNFYAIKVVENFIIVNPIFDANGIVIRLDTIEEIEQSVYPETSDDPNAQVALGQVVVSDQFFDGQAYKMSFKASYYNSSSYFTVKVRSLTEDYYLYLISETRKEDSEDLPLVEPVTVHSNLNKGIGAFGMYSEKRFLIH